MKLIDIKAKCLCYKLKMKGDEINRMTYIDNVLF